MKICKKGSRCGLFRICKFCARVRQAHVADIAEQVLSHYPVLYPARITPDINSPVEIERIKSAIKRQLGAYSGLWSVEVGEVFGLLHLNIITPKNILKPIKGTHYWQGQALENLRRYAAYMVKPSQIPDLSQYRGRQFGSWQSMTDLFKNERQLPVIQGAYHENYTLADFKIPTPYLDRQKEIAEARKYSRKYSDIANDRLLKLRAYIAANKGTLKGDKKD